MEKIKNNKIEYLNSPVTAIKGIGPKKEQLFHKLGIYSILDLIYNFPREYEDRRSIKKISECFLDDVCCIKVRPVKQIIERKIKQKLSLFILYATDGNDYITIKWFSAPFAKPKIRAGETFVVYGRYTSQNGKKEFEMKYMENAENQKYTGSIVPIYHVTNGIHSKTVAECISMAISYAKYIEDSIPEYIRNQYSLPCVNEALKQMHCPKNYETLSLARSRFVFEELFVFQLALLRLRERRCKTRGAVIENLTENIRSFSSGLPFELTQGQKNAINEICFDLKSGRQMNRIVQGDVGCGKTAVAAAVVYAVCKSGRQSVFMAPTEILAFQHFETFKGFLGDKLKIALLTSSSNDKKKIKEDISLGFYDLVIGTHALIEDNVKFNNLSLCITDEQHRFGVNQRAILTSKGENPHVLVMSATPIPRTLSLILYGDLDISIIKSMPKGRQKVETFHITTDMRERAYGFLKKQVYEGRQCYIVCPLVDESEEIDAVSVEEHTKKLKEGIFSDIRVEFVHGKMKAAEKEKIMESFKNGKIDVLISTTVIEVGVDVQNSTVMMIENAERFGLSQLHQLRGRVGRGDYKSYCILVSDSKTDNARERMKIMTKSHDGFEISQKDMELRGSGQFFGTKQHGLPELKIANLFSDTEILKKVQDVSEKIIKEDPNLENEELLCVKERIENIFKSFENDIFN